MANGTFAAHAALERELAAFFGLRDAMVFSTGYQANLGMLSALAGRDDVMLLDADCHASIYDGCRLGDRRSHPFPPQQRRGPRQAAAPARRARGSDADRRRGHLQHAGRPGAAGGDRRRQAQLRRPICWWTRRIRSACWASTGGASPRRPVSRTRSTSWSAPSARASARSAASARATIPSSTARALRQPAVHVHRVALTLDRRLGPRGPRICCRPGPSCASRLWENAHRSL